MHGGEFGERTGIGHLLVDRNNVDAVSVTCQSLHQLVHADAGTINQWVGKSGGDVQNLHALAFFLGIKGASKRRYDFSMLRPIIRNRGFTSPTNG